MLTFTGIGFLWNPKFVVESGLVALIGASMEVKPLIVTQDNLSTLALSGLVFLILGMIYTISLLQSNFLFFSGITPIRAIFDFILTGFIYLKKEHIASNSLTFTFAFCDLMWQFWMFAAMSEERAKYLKNQKKAEELAARKAREVEES